jgi:hypothetical protein
MKAIALSAMSFREVVTVLGLIGLLDEVIILDQLRVPLVGLTAEKED